MAKLGISYIVKYDAREMH